MGSSEVSDKFPRVSIGKSLDPSGISGSTKVTSRVACAPTGEAKIPGLGQVVPRHHAGSLGCGADAFDDVDDPAWRPRAEVE